MAGEVFVAESFKTETGIFIPIFSADRKQLFEGWHCLNCHWGMVEEKVVAGAKSELRCVNCGAEDIYFYKIDDFVDESLKIQSRLAEIFGDIDAICFK